MALRNFSGPAVASIDYMNMSPVSAEINRCQQPRRSAANNKTIRVFQLELSRISYLLETPPLPARGSLIFASAFDRRGMLNEVRRFSFDDVQHFPAAEYWKRNSFRTDCKVSRLIHAWFSHQALLMLGVGYLISVNCSFDSGLRNSSYDNANERLGVSPFLEDAPSLHRGTLQVYALRKHANKPSMSSE